MSSGNVHADELLRAINDLRDARRHVAMAQSTLDGAEARVRWLEELVIPHLLEELGTKIYKLPDGTTLELKDKLFASIPAATAQEVFDWLNANKHGGLIKRTVVVAFDREREAEARALLEELRPRFAAAATKFEVNTNTLSAWVREQFREGRPVPDGVAIETRQVATLKDPD